MQKTILSLCIGSLFAFQLGCSSGKSEWNPTDADHIVATVSEISDARSEPDKLNSLFVAGSEPDEAWIEQSKQCMLRLDPEAVSVSGETASAVVEKEDNLEGSVTNTPQWQFQREGDQWKIKTAPLQ